VNVTRAFAWNLGTCRSDVKGEAQVEAPQECQSTNAEHRDGPERMSGEVSVMEMEQRSPGYSVMRVSQSEMKGAHEQSKAICYFQTYGLGSVQEGQSE
jgi:hypothetical protein